MSCCGVWTVPRVGACVVLITLVNAARTRAGAATGSAVREAISAGLPKYDAKVRAAHLANDETARVEEGEVADTVAAYGVKADASSAAGAASAEEIVILSRIVVQPGGGAEAANVEPTVRLPRLVVRPKEGAAAEEFETPAARDERLVKKHLSALDRLVLNRFSLFGKSKEQRAREAEAIEQQAWVLGEVAELIEFSQETGGEGETAEERELRELYLDVFVSRPK